MCCILGKQIAMKYGGGGHKGASGFSTDELIFRNN